MANKSPFELDLSEINLKDIATKYTELTGANIVNILATLNKDFVKWITLAFIVAVPISWFTMLKWLEGFAYRTAISWWVFAVAGCTALVIALLTVSWQSLKAAIANPVDALKDE